jgi:hypothetical protein
MTMKLLGTYTMAAMTVALAPLTVRAADARCPLLNATLHGTYVVSGSGTIAGVGQVTALGQHTWDGQGNTIATNTISANGNILNVTVTGTYTVNPDCTASLAESDGSHYQFLIAPDGSKAWWIQTDPGTVVSGTEVRLRRRHIESVLRVPSKK